MATEVPAKPEPRISVHVQLPYVVAAGAIDLSPTNWRWVHCLDISVDILNNHSFSLKPYKWIRFATGVVVGAYGDLSFGLDQLEIPDYNADRLVDPVRGLYYHINDAEKRRMFPTDPQLGGSKITSSVATSRRAGLREELIERDGSCVLCGSQELLCDGVHLIAHSKGDSYIESYTRYRSRDPNRGDCIDSIDSPRNAILLNKLPHVVFGKHVAFLVVHAACLVYTNFRLIQTLNRLPISPWVVENATDPTMPRCTAHLFLPESFYLGDPRLHSGHQVRVAVENWPPGILFDAVYASAILEHFSAPGFREVVIEAWRDVFYPSEIRTLAEASRKKIIDKRNADKEETRQNRSDRFQRRASGGADYEPDNFDLLMAIPYIMIPQEKRQVMLREAAQRAEAAEKGRVKEVVDRWRQQVSPT